MSNSKPVSEIRSGSVKAVIWANDTEGRIRYTVTVSHLYKDTEQRKTTQTFGRNDLLFLVPRPTISLDSDLRNYNAGGSRYVQRNEGGIRNREGSP